jgi:small-conductance mechanosensitive channel
VQIDLSAAVQKLHSMGQSTIELLPNLVIALIAFTAFWLTAGLVARGIGSILQRAGQPQHVALVLSRVLRWLVLAMGVMVAATVVVPSLNASSLLGALGVGGVAIGFAFKDIFQNLLAGLLLLMTRPFSIGDQIVSGPHEGTVEDIQVRATLVRTYDNHLVVIPNSELYTSRVEVNTAKENRRVEVTVGIGLGDEIGHAKDVILQALRGVPSILGMPTPTVLERQPAGLLLGRAAQARRDPGGHRRCHLRDQARIDRGWNRSAVPNAAAAVPRSDRRDRWRQEPAARRLAGREEDATAPALVSAARFGRRGASARA